MNKKNIILGLILVVLIALAYFYQGPLKNKEEKNNFLADVAMEEVNKMEITRNGSSTVLIKEGEAKWKVEGEGDFYIKEDVAGDLEEKMASLTRATFELISTDPEKKSRFRSNEEKGSRVKLYDNGDQVADFIVGSLDSSTLNSTYVSQAGIDETYSAQNVELTGLMLRDDWRSKVIFDTAKNRIAQIRFQYPDREFTVEKTSTSSSYSDPDLNIEDTESEEQQGPEWQGTIPRNFSVSDDQMNQIADIMSDLEAVRIPEQEFEGTGLSEHLIIVEASGADFSNTLMVGEKDGKQGDRELYYAKKGSSDNIYLITGEQRDTLNQTIQSLQ